jgi:alpha-tubulin suppressor-like RCC1 family protein
MAIGLVIGTATLAAAADSHPWEEGFAPTLSAVADVEVLLDTNFAVTSDGRVYSWGPNWQGNIGRYASSSIYHHPMVISGLPPIEKVRLQPAAVIALAKDGTVWTWGQYVNPAVLGRGDAAVNGPLPGKVFGLTGVKDMSVNSFFSDPIALKSNGEVWAWGANNGSTLGNGTSGSSSVPVRVHNLGNVKKVFPAIAWTYALS